MTQGLAEKYSQSIGWTCPFCHQSAGYITKHKISTGGIIVFVVMLFVCFPLCLIGLGMKEASQHCRSCGTKVG